MEGIAHWLPLRVDPSPTEHAELIACEGHLTTIAGRISECNRIRLIKADYDNGGASARCVAMRNTHFCIKLFRGETEKHIIVVIEKESGCDLIFREEYHALMCAARFGEIHPRKVSIVSKEEEKHDDDSDLSTKSEKIAPTKADEYFKLSTMTKQRVYNDDALFQPPALYSE